MGVLFEYFVAADEEVEHIDLAVAPSQQLPSGQVAELPGLDPAVILLGVVEVLSGREFEEILDEASGSLVAAGGEDGPWLEEISPMTVDTIRRADQDPTTDWPSVVARWTEVNAEELDGDGDGLSGVLRSLRALIGTISDGTKLYCWTSL